MFVSLAAFGALVSDAATFHVFTSAISFPISLAIETNLLQLRCCRIEDLSVPSLLTLMNKLVTPRPDLFLDDYTVFLVIVSVGVVIDTLIVFTV